MLPDSKTSQYESSVPLLLHDFKHNKKSHPHIILGQFERVGSTFLLDNYETSHIVYNEPYKQLVPPDWPIARGYQGKLFKDSDEFFASHDVQSLNKLWMYNFVISKYIPEGQIIKETNLYFALPVFLSFFPFRSVEILSRHPLGILGSFARNNLFYAWRYQYVLDALQRQVSCMTPEKQKKYGEFFALNADWRVKILRLIALNSLLIAETLYAETPKITKYDDVIRLANPSAPLERDENSIFGTAFRKEYDDFDKRFDDAIIDLLKKEAATCTKLVHQHIDKRAQKLFDTLFTDYFGSGFHRRSPVASTSSKEKKMSHFETYPIEKKLPERVEFLRLLPSQHIEWASRLVTNQEMGLFIQELLDSGLDPSLVHLLLREGMIPERGGRLQLDAPNKRILITKQYERHPAYWISWLGAAAYALRVGAVLPTSSEWQQAYESYDWPPANIANHTYAYDDTIETGKIADSGVPMDFFGNVKIWCSDWADALFQNKKLAGISWKHNFSETYRTITEKPLLTNSRVIGARLVRCRECPPTSPRTPREIVQLMDAAGKQSGIASPTAANIAEVNQKIGFLFDRSIGCKHCN